MQRTNATRRDESEASASPVRREADRIRLSGVLRTPDAEAIWSALKEATRDVTRCGRIEMDMSAVSAVDGDVMALLVEIRAQIAARGGEVKLTGMCQDVARLADLYGANRPPSPGSRSPPESAIAEIGAAAFVRLSRLEDALGFLGALLLASPGARRHARTRRPSQILSIVEKAGAEAMGIVFPFVAIVGFTFSYATADEFIRLGQRLLSATLIGRAMTREIAPVMTAIIVAGRSGAAFAAEIGSMKINHELDAMRTLGLEPLRRLVLPRVGALMLALPGLVILADFFGVGGGALVGVTLLGIRLPIYVHALRSAVSLWDVLSGIVKSTVFGLAIALIACQQGFAVSGGPEEVGRHTKSAVVESLFSIVVVDAILTVIYRSFGG